MAPSLALVLLLIICCFPYITTTSSTSTAFSDPANTYLRPSKRWKRINTAAAQRHNHQQVGTSTSKPVEGPELAGSGSKSAGENAETSYNLNPDAETDNNCQREPDISEASASTTTTTTFVAECNMPTASGIFKMRAYTYSSNDQFLEPVVMVSGDVRGKENVLVRVHDQCFTSEVFGSLRCDCREQLEESLKLIQEEGGIVIYLQQEGRGIGIANKIAAYNLQDEGLDTVDANVHLGFQDDYREYHCVSKILEDMEIKSIKLMTNNPYKIDRIVDLGVKVAERVPLVMRPNPYNLGYIRSKQNRMSHMIPQHVTADPDTPSAATVQQKQQEPAKTAADYAHLRRDFPFGKQSVVDALAAIGRGEMVIVVDDENRENEGDLIMAAEMATPETIGFIVRHSSGVICVSMESDRLVELQLPPMVVNNQDPKQTAYTVSVDFKHGTTTGISAADRAACFRALADPSSTFEDFQRPGHVFPLRYKAGGVLERGGHTEASMDLTRLAGLRPASVLAEVVNDDGTIKRLPDLIAMAKEFGLVMTSVQDLIAYRLEILEASEQQKQQQS